MSSRKTQLQTNQQGAPKGQWVEGPTPDFRSGRDPRVVGLSSASRLKILSLLPPTLTRACSLALFKNLKQVNQEYSLGDRAEGRRDDGPQSRVLARAALQQREQPYAQLADSYPEEDAQKKWMYTHAQMFKTSALQQEKARSSPNELVKYGMW